MLEQLSTETHWLSRQAAREAAGWTRDRLAEAMDLKDPPERFRYREWQAGTQAG